MKTHVIVSILVTAALSGTVPGSFLQGQEVSPVGVGPGREGAQELTPIPSGFRMTIPSRHLGESRDVLIRLPDGYSDEEGEGGNRYAVLYILGGDDYFLAFAGLVDYLTMFELVPDLIVVGVPQNDAMKEFTFSPANAAYGDFPTSGGAEPFHLFLKEELVPLVDRRFRTNPYRMLVGHSLGGLFAIECMGRSPDLFQATLALSPSLQWNQYEWLRASDTLFDDTAFWRQTLVISLESRTEEADRRLAEFEALVDAEAPRGFEYDLSRYPEESHASMGVPGFYHSIQRVFRGWTLEEEWWQLGPEALRAHFSGLSERYGYPVSIPEADLVAHARHGLLSHEAPDEAIRLLELCLDLYPGSANARVGLGDAYLRKGDREGAREWYRKALEVDPNHASARRKLEGIGEGIGTLSALRRPGIPGRMWAVRTGGIRNVWWGGVLGTAEAFSGFSGAPPVGPTDLGGQAPPL
jgi:predicted alpha/beta superfamily hydrolase